MPRSVELDEPLSDTDAVFIAEGVCGFEDADEELQRRAWQHLHDTGLAYRSQGWFGRQAQHLIREGVING